MSNIDKIRQEIERRLQRENEILWNAKKRGTYPSSSCEYNLLTLTSLRDFINSLPEEKPSEDLNDEIKKFIEEYGYERGEDKLLIAIVARHFAEWGAKHLK